MGQVTLNPADVANAQLGIDLPVAYGYVRAQGNEVLNHVLANKNRIVIRILAEGEWDGADRIWVNAKQINLADTTLVHFHPGIDGVLGHGLGPDSNGGDQLVDNFWSSLPPNFQPTTYSRKASLMLNIPPDPAAPSATLTLIGDYRTTVVRQFDSSGNQTGYAFSTNGAEQCVDVILRTMLKPEWNTSAARAAGGDLVAAEKARIDWPSYANAVSWCNTLLANGQKRFESSVAFAQRTAVIDALKQLCAMSQLYITEANGRIFICADQPRSSTFLLKSDHVVAGTASFDKINLHGAQNRLVANFNDLNAQGIADIDTIANNGLSRSGTGVVTVLTKTNHPFALGQNIQIVPPQDGTTHDGGFDGVFPIASVPALNKFTYAQAGNANWLLWSEQFDNAVWQKGTGVSVVANNQTDPLGGNTADTVTSSSSGTLWPIFQDCPINTANGLQFTFSVWLRAAANTSVRLQVERPAGDTESVIVTVTNVWQRFNFTHSAAWAGVQAVEVVVTLTTPSTSIFVWGAQVEDGPVATAYRQTTNATAGVISGNGTVGTPESRFAVRAPIIDHGQHQNAIGQRGLSLTPIFRVVPLTINLGNNTVERANRIMTYLLNRNLGINTVPYVAPWAGTITCFMDAVDLSVPRALMSLLPGEILTVDATVSEEYQGDYEITKEEFIVPSVGASNGNGNGQANQAVINLTLLQYLPASFSDTSLVAQSLRASIPGGLVPIASVDSLGVQRLAGTFRNNTVNTNGTFTGGNPLTQSGTSTTIPIAASTMQFGDGQVSYNSGSVNPGSYNTFFVFADDPSFLGGAVVYHFNTNKSVQVAANARVSFGQITTAGGGGGTGSGGGGAGCFCGNTKVRVSNKGDGYALLRFSELTGSLIAIETEHGRRVARKHTRRYCGWMLDMGDGELVTPQHLIKVTAGFFDAAETIWKDRVWYEGEVHTLQTLTDVDAERHFILGNGRTAHNISPGL